ncbi:ATP-binding protein [Micromonospora nigra]|uniref:ATP-binding protein n=1 Tax=Micromonospora nigra TaxID=145857 RepID=UPI001FDFD0FF|nr:ATP-binding protein [Micromonospora nigra]
MTTGWTYPALPVSAARMRQDVRAALAALDADPDAVDDLLVATSEAINNAVEHAQRPSRPEVRVGLRVVGDTACVSVRDFGTWREGSPSRDRGRGVALMQAYGRVRTECTAQGTTVTIERRLHDRPR